jgi:hypothetical protein
VPVINLRKRIGIARSQEFRVRRRSEFASTTSTSLLRKKCVRLTAVAVCGESDTSRHLGSGAHSSGRERRILVGGVIRIGDPAVEPQAQVARLRQRSERHPRTGAPNLGRTGGIFRSISGSVAGRTLVFRSGYFYARRRRRNRRTPAKRLPYRGIN